MKNITGFIQGLIYQKKIASALNRAELKIHANSAVGS